MRVLLALLDIDPKKRNELTVPIRKLIETGTTTTIIITTTTIITINYSK